MVRNSIWSLRLANLVWITSSYPSSHHCRSCDSANLTIGIISYTSRLSLLRWLLAVLSPAVIRDASHLLSDLSLRPTWSLWTCHDLESTELTAREITSGSLWIGIISVRSLSSRKTKGATTSSHTTSIRSAGAQLWTSSTTRMLKSRRLSMEWTKCSQIGSSSLISMSWVDSNLASARYLTRIYSYQRRQALSRNWKTFLLGNLRTLLACAGTRSLWWAASLTWCSTWVCALCRSASRTATAITSLRAHGPSYQTSLSASFILLWL